MAARRLMRDLEELKSSPVSVNISAHPMPSDIYKWHGNLRIPEHDITVHYELSFTCDYPIEPPSILLKTAIPHSNVYTAPNNSRKIHLCLDMLQRGRAAPYQGWSTAYTVRTILLQLESLMQDPESLRGNPFIGTMDAALIRANHFNCADCGHRGDGRRTWPRLPKHEDLERKVYRDYETPQNVDVKVCHGNEPLKI